MSKRYPLPAMYEPLGQAPTPLPREAFLDTPTLLSCHGLYLPHTAFITQCAAHIDPSHDAELWGQRLG